MNYEFQPHREPGPEQILSGRLEMLAAALRFLYAVVPMQQQEAVSTLPVANVPTESRPEPRPASTITTEINTAPAHSEVPMAQVQSSVPQSVEASGVVVRDNEMATLEQDALHQLDEIYGMQQNSMQATDDQFAVGA